MINGGRAPTWTFEQESGTGISGKVCLLVNRLFEEFNFFQNLLKFHLTRIHATMDLEIRTSKD